MIEAELAGQVVGWLVPYAEKAAGKAVEKVAGESLGALWDRVKAKLTGMGAERTVEAFEAAPTDTRRQGTLEADLEDALKADPAFAEEVQRLVHSVSQQAGRDATSQTATTIGDHNRTTQIVGSGNRVG